ncbi:nitroreductase/quinone reductase family protein [Mycobacterium sp. RTGN5]|uniref:nitroreductase/quinone reductase family protein n=1 Tax=Mycobacterium sp. RTGN5 TaxID=3016522 RepID=UPI0029C8F1C7|nr:nitroreductase/quinone reductase family protein [Mycobacterium sp. RTGN5]
MADADAAALRASRADWTAQHLATYLESGGAQGHILNLNDVGGRTCTTHGLIRYTGRKSGQRYIKPLIYGNFGGEIVIVASKGGADSHPEWYRNVVSHDTLDVQIATQAFEASWREPEGEERHQVWEYMCHLYPPYIAYQQSTSRRIPIVMLNLLRPTAIFTAES